MSLKAFIFPGQGSQYIGMAQDIHEEYPLVRERFEEASDILGYNLAELCFNGPEEQLNTTSFTQPAIYVHSVVMYELFIQNGIKPDMVAGHSLGEFSALTAAGSLDFKTGLAIVQQRGLLMQNASEFEKGTMAAIIGLDNETVQAVCQQALQTGTVGVANYNSPGQVVISGSIDGVHAAMELAKEQGAKRALELKVSGAFHSPLMETAQQDFKKKMNETNFQIPEITLYSNVTAAKAETIDDIKTLLSKQLSSPVLWVQTIKAMSTAGAQIFYEVGPGNVLTGLNKRIDRSLNTLTVNKLEQLKSLKEQA